MKRILAVIHSPYYGGLHNILIKIRQPLLASGYEMICAVPAAGSGIERLRAAQVEVLPLELGRVRRTFDPRCHLRLVRGFRGEVGSIQSLIERQRIDVALIAGLVNPHGAIAAAAAGIPVVWQVHSDFAPWWLRACCMQLVKRYATVLMANGRRIATLHPGALRFGERLVYFAAPVDTCEFAPSLERRRAARAELGIRDDEFLVGTVGVRGRQKSHELLVAAAQLLRGGAQKLRFLIMGAPIASQAKYYENMVIGAARRQGLLHADYLQFLDPGSQVKELLPALDLFALTSRAEGIPTVLLEAMACGVPIVSTAVGGVPDLITSEVDGLLAPVGDARAMADAIVRFAASDSLRQGLVERGRSRVVREFGVAACAAAHVRSFEMALRCFTGGGAESERRVTP